MTQANNIRRKGLENLSFWLFKDHSVCISRQKHTD